MQLEIWPLITRQRSPTKGQRQRRAIANLSEKPQLEMSEKQAQTGNAKAQETKSNFASDVAKLAGGTTFAQAFTIAVSPLLSRLYAPDSLGTASLFTSIVTVLGVEIANGQVS